MTTHKNSCDGARRTTRVYVAERRIFDRTRYTTVEIIHSSLSSSSSSSASSLSLNDKILKKSTNKYLTILINLLSMYRYKSFAVKGQSGQMWEDHRLMSKRKRTVQTCKNVHEKKRECSTKNRATYYRCIYIDDQPRRGYYSLYIEIP